MTRRTLLPLVAAGAAVLGLAGAAPAGAAQVGPQQELRAPARYPESLPGCSPRCVRGRTIRRGWVVLRRQVRLDARERRTSVRLRCPGGRRFRTFGNAGDVLIQIPEGQLPYDRRSRVRLVAERLLTPVGRPARGTVYAVCVPR